MRAAPPAPPTTCLKATFECPKPEHPLPQQSEARVLGQLLLLARQIRQPRAYVGHSAFILFALLKKCRPFIWEGDSRVDLVGIYAPWLEELCIRSCVVDGVCCCLEALPAGMAVMHPVTEAHPLRECKHYLSCTRSHPMECADSSIQGFYTRLGVVLLGTVADGDCGMDVACQMLAIYQSAAERSQLREEISDYLIQRVEEPWMQDLMVACQEISADDVAALRADGLGRPGSGVIEETDAAAVAVAEDEALAVVAVVAEDEAAAVAEDSAEAMVAGAVVPMAAGAVAPTAAVAESLRLKRVLAALKWVTRINDASVLQGLASSLPDPVLNEQLRLYDERPAAVATTSNPAVAGDTRIVLNPRSLVSRGHVAKAYDDYRRTFLTYSRLPKHTISRFIEARVQCVRGAQCTPRQLNRWHNAWKRDSTLVYRDHLKRGAKLPRGARVVPLHLRQRRFGLQGKPAACQWVRQELFEWFVAMRYSIDWKKMNRDLRERRQYKAMGRFPRSLFKNKARQFLEDYVHQCLVKGVQVESFAISSAWITRWEKDFGLSLRAPNRKFGVPLYVVQERLIIFWCILARLRALCIEIHGYDPEFENFDQTPMHRNELGSEGKGTLAVAGLDKVPLVEGHSDTRERWTANLTTFSNKERILQGEIPYSEMCFKSEGQKMELRLKEYIRSRGWGPWLTVATSPKGSYREADVITFLERHLPAMHEGRRWRIILADDFGPHKTKNVWRLCWSRGYVMVALGGGTTPVVQTPDTDLNQHVKRHYTEREASLLVYQMRSGVCVPRPSEEECIDMMAELLSDTRLHLEAADGFKKTGATVALHGREDHMIVREAGQHWKDLHMRERIDREVAQVKEEVRAGRLKWTKEGVLSLITPYPARKDVDEALARMEDNNDVEVAGDEDSKEQPAVAGEGDEESESDDDEEQTEEQPAAAGEEQPAVAAEGDEIVFDGCGQRGVATDVAVPELTEPQAEILLRSQVLVQGYRESREEMMKLGAMRSVVHLDNEIRKELRRQRGLGAVDSAVADCLFRQRCVQDAEDARKRRLAAEDNARTRTHAKVRKDLQDAKQSLKKRKAQLLEVENLVASKHTMKTYTAAALGHGHPKGGFAVARKRRFEVLDRLARNGSGLTETQANDFSWFKEAWDDRMAGELRQDWGGTFAGWMQKILDEFEGGVGNAFSAFVHNETARCFADEPALTLGPTPNST